MLPATTRKSLRIPHHLAILAAGVSLAIAFYVDLYQVDSDPSISLTQVQAQTDQSTPVDSAANTEQQTSQTRGASRIRFDLPRLLPWAKPQPRSE
ncbi:MAG TPA: hypothetical protein VIC53_09670 [Wenzhouxiangella sp.]